MRGIQNWPAVLALVAPFALGTLGACAASSKQAASPSSARYETAAGPAADAPAGESVGFSSSYVSADSDDGGVDEAEEASAPAPAMRAPAAEAPPAATPPPAANAQAQQQAGGKSQPVQAAEGPSQPLLIYTATLHLAVFEAGEALDAIEEMARQRGGYLVRRTDTGIVIRVPAPVFHETLGQVGKLGDVLHRDVTAQDVTAEFRDLEVRLRNLQVVRARLEQLLSQAKTVQDALMVERELERITTEMEQIKGRLKLFRELIAFSTINVNFQPRPVERVTSTVKLPFPWLDDLGLNRLLDLSN